MKNVWIIIGVDHCDCKEVYGVAFDSTAIEQKVQKVLELSDIYDLKEVQVECWQYDTMEKDAYFYEVEVFYPMENG